MEVVEASDRRGSFHGSTSGKVHGRSYRKLPWQYGWKLPREEIVDAAVEKVEGHPYICSNRLSYTTLGVNTNNV